jgi:hypothetical protein
MRPHHRNRLLLGLLIAAAIAAWKAIIWLFN